MVHGLSEPQLEHQGLQPPLQEVLGGQGKHIIQLVLALLQQAVLVHAPQQRLSLEDPLRLFVIQGQQGTSSLQAGQLLNQSACCTALNHRLTSKHILPNPRYVTLVPHRPGTIVALMDYLAALQSW